MNLVGWQKKHYSAIVLPVLFIIIVACIIYIVARKDDSVQAPQTELAVPEQDLQLAPLGLRPKNAVELSDAVYLELQRQRILQGLGLLIRFNELDASARAKAELLSGTCKLDHKPLSSSLLELVSASGYKNLAKAGENLAVGFDTAEELVAAWLNSAVHRRVVYGDYNNAGVGGAMCKDGRYVIVLHMASKYNN